MGRGLFEGSARAAGGRRDRVDCARLSQESKRARDPLRHSPGGVGGRETCATAAHRRASRARARSDGDGNARPASRAVSDNFRPARADGRKGQGERPPAGGEGSTVFRAVKRLERAGLRRADQVVVLTEKMRDRLAQSGLAPASKVTVIPCCVSMSRFAGEVDEGAAVRNDAAGLERFEVVYAGAATGLYLLEEMGRFFLAVRELRPGAFFRVLTRSDTSHVSEVLRRAGLSDGEFWVGAVEPSQVPAYLNRARLGLSFRKPTLSQVAASPTKISEYLAAGLPAVSNEGVGATDEILEA